MQLLYLSYLQISLKQVYYTAKEVTKFKNERVIIPYRGNRNPDTISLNDFVRNPGNGAGCQTTAIGLMRSLGYELPHVRSLELAHNQAHTETVHSFSELKPHDIIIYLPKDGRTDPRYGHPTIAHVEGGTLYIVHNSVGNGRALMQPARHEDQGRIAVIKRPVLRPRPVNHQFLQSVGFEPLAQAV